ncbi:aromatic ring-opening dioxygenase catalytic subunit (LigB family) [Sphingomonas sp. UYEF23]
MPARDRPGKHAANTAKRAVSGCAIVGAAPAPDIAGMKLPTLFIPHGGGPCFFMDPAGGLPDPMWRPMQAYLAGLIASLPERPRAILLVSGHWETPELAINTGDGHPLDYDYFGFPPHTYRLDWPSHGDPALAQRVSALLADAGIAHHGEERGWDHGVFIPMMVAVPGADIPLVQLSLRADLDPAGHIAIGRALAPLRDEGVLIVGSGMSFHNLRARGPQVTPIAAAWAVALTAAVTDPDPVARAARVAAWDTLPNARFAHPEAEHLLPLMVALGAGGEDAAICDYRDVVMGWVVSGYRFG